MYINPIKHGILPAKQVEEIDFRFKSNDFLLQQLSKHVRLALDLYGQQITCPLHLHLADFNLAQNYRRQRATVHYRAPPFSYFYETLERLQLKFPDELGMEKPFEQNLDQEVEDVVKRQK